MLGWGECTPADIPLNMACKVADRLFLIAGCFIYAFDLSSLEKLYAPPLEIYMFEPCLVCHQL